MSVIERKYAGTAMRAFVSRYEHLLMLAGILALLILGSYLGLEGETAEGWCAEIFASGPMAPAWAAREGSFSNYSECVDWYVTARSQAGP